jgi:hypothetical protein
MLPLPHIPAPHWMSEWNDMKSAPSPLYCYDFGSLNKDNLESTTLLNHDNYCKAGEPAQRMRALPGICRIMRA